MDDRMISEEAAAEMLGWSLQTLRINRYKGRGPKFVQERKGGTVRYWTSAIKAWADANTHDPAAESGDAQDLESEAPEC